MKKLLMGTVLLMIFSSMASAAGPAVVAIDPILFDESGWTWGAFAEPDAVLATKDGIVLNIPVSEFSDWPDTTNGGMGVTFNSAQFGGDGLDFDPELYQIEVPFRVLSGNEAQQFRVTIKEYDTPQTGDEYQYHVDLFDKDIGEWSTFTVPVTDYSAVWTEGGDQLQEFRVQDIQIMTMWNAIDVLNVEIGGYYITPIDPPNDGVVFEFNANNFQAGYTYDSFSEPDAVVNDLNTIVVDAVPSEFGNPFGGLGLTWSSTDFDPETHEIAVTAKRGANNEAAVFRVAFEDEDGLEALNEMAAEEWVYEFLTDDFSDTEFTTVRQGLTEPLYRQQPGNKYEGDEEVNFGAYKVQFQSMWGDLTRLNMEIKSIQIVEKGGGGVPGDFDGDGELTAADIDLLAKAIRDGSTDAKYDLNRDSKVDSADHTAWVKDKEYKYTYIGDADLDGRFTSGDFVLTFLAGKYETNESAGWAEGDWDGDAKFGSPDFIAAFLDGGYELPPRPAVAAVPEPAGFTLLTLSLLPLLTLRRRD